VQASSKRTEISALSTADNTEAPDVNYFQSAESGPKNLRAPNRDLPAKYWQYQPGARDPRTGRELVHRNCNVSAS
jgi:hypothetical protein